MNTATAQPWYQLYASAIVELDPKQLIERIESTQAAIRGRLLDLQYDSDHHEERKMMCDAERTLKFLRRYPSSVHETARHPAKFCGQHRIDSQ
jgi:hypothetical protein